MAVGAELPHVVQARIAAVVAAMRAEDTAVTLQFDLLLAGDQHVHDVGRAHIFFSGDRDRPGTDRDVDGASVGSAGEVAFEMPVA
jgi:hypothetical protein